MKQEQNAIQKGTNNKKEVLQFENMIAEIKNYIIGLEDRVIEITQKVEQKIENRRGKTKEIRRSLEKSYYAIKRSS